MSNGLGAAFAGVTFFAVLLVTAGLLVVVTVGGAFYQRRSDVRSYVTSVGVGLTGVVVAVAVFAIVALADEAPALAALFGATVGLPVVLVAGRTRLRGASWKTVAALSGMAWSLPFLAASGLLFIAVSDTELPAAVLTGVVAVVAAGGALLWNEYVGDALYPEETSKERT